MKTRNVCLVAVLVVVALVLIVLHHGPEPGIAPREDTSVKCVRRIHTGTNVAVAFSPKGDMVAAGRLEGEGDRGVHQVCLWESSTGALRSQVGKLEGLLVCVAISKDGRVIGATDTSDRITVWDVDTRVMHV